MRPSQRIVPEAGMPVRVLHLGEERRTAIERVEDEGRTVIVDDERYTLRRANARFVREGEGAYGTRLAFGDGGG